MKTNPTKANEKADLIIKNHYRGLMTRGLKGCYIYFTDQATADFVRDRVVSDQSGELLAEVVEPQSTYESLAP